MGYVDPGPVPRMDGVLRVVTPLMTFPNSSVSAYDPTGNKEFDTSFPSRSMG